MKSPTIKSSTMREGGFTLLELMVALAVASIALASGFATLGIVEERGSHAEEVNRTALSGATQRALLMDWLAGARFRAPSEEIFTGIEAEENNLPMDQIQFPTTARTPVNRNSTLVLLYVDIDEATPERGLVAELSDGSLAAEPTRMELAPSAGSMEIRYLPEADGTTEWVDGWVERGGLPRGVVIVLSPVVGDSLPPLLRLPLRVALPSLR